MIPRLPTLAPWISFSKEKDFQDWILKSMRANWWWAYKLPDTGYDYKPYDIICVKDGTTIHLELKVTAGSTIPISAIRANQKFSMTEIEKRWGVGMIAVYSKKTWVYKTFRFLEFLELSKKWGVPITEQTL